MAINIRDLIKEDLWDWLTRSADSDFGESAGDFWVNPVPPSDAGYKDACDRELAFIKRVSKIDAYGGPHIRGLRFVADNLHYVCIQDIDGLDRLSVDQPDYYTELPVDFLLSVLVCTKLSLPSTRPIPVRLLTDSRKDGALAGDLLDYLPRLRLFRLSREHEEGSLIAILSSIYCETFRSGAGAWVGEEALSLRLSIPERDHDWLLQEFIEVLAAKRLSSMYLNLYRLVEFFFPLQGVNSLKKGMGTNAAILDVLEKCRVNLGWYWQHGKSAKVAASMAPSGRFLAPLVAAGVCSGSVEAADGAEKLVNLRNELSHQGFKLINYEDAVLRAAITAAFIYCAEAFGKYREWL